MPMNPSQMLYNGPIPGQSLTGAPGNAAYEKPPQYTQVDDAIQFIIKQFSNKETVHEFLAVLEAGAPMDVVVLTMLKHGFAEGKWTPSLMALIMQPVTMFLTQVAHKAGIKFIPSYNNGPSENLTKLYEMIDKNKAQDKVSNDEVNAFSEAMQTSSPSSMAPTDVAAPVAPPSGGLMSPKGTV